MPENREEQVILGIDPGTRITGYGLIRCTSHSYQLIDFGCIRPPVHLPPSARYLVIFEAVEELLSLHRPQALSVETQFVYKNVQSAMKLGMARAAALIAAEKAKVPIFEYAPKKAKLAVVGHGAASKHQVQRMIQALLKLSVVPEPEDAADALAIAICHAHTINRVNSITMQ